MPRVLHLLQVCEDVFSEDFAKDVHVPFKCVLGMTFEYQ